MNDNLLNSDENDRDPFKSVSETGNPYKNLDSDPDPSGDRGQLIDREDREIREQNQFDSAD